MKCPTCSTDLALADRQGVEIDYCPQCRGVWLDRGELDKIIERSERDEWAAPPRKEREGSHPRGKRKKSFLGELFEFGD